MGKLSGLAANSSPALTDTVVSVQSPGAGPTDVQVTIAKLLGMLQGNSVLAPASYTNTGTGGGTGYYINLGGIKICWGITGLLSTTGTGPYSNSVAISLPASFFTTIQFSVINSQSGNTGLTTTVGAGCTTSTLSAQLWVLSGASNSTATFGYLVIGT